MGFPTLLGRLSACLLSTFSSSAPAPPAVYRSLQAILLRPPPGFSAHDLTSQFRKKQPQLPVLAFLGTLLLLKPALPPTCILCPPCPWALSSQHGTNSLFTSSPSPNLHLAILLKLHFLISAMVIRMPTMVMKTPSLTYILLLWPT